VATHQSSSPATLTVSILAWELRWHLSHLRISV
jgi:hypothetical protein